MRYIKESTCRAFCKERGKQASKEFLTSVDILVEHILSLACNQFNGHRKRLSSYLIPSNIKNPLKGGSEK